MMENLADRAYLDDFIGSIYTPPSLEARTYGVTPDPKWKNCLKAMFVDGITGISGFAASLAVIYADKFVRGEIDAHQIRLSAMILAAGAAYWVGSNARRLTAEIIGYEKIENSGESQ